MSPKFFSDKWRAIEKPPAKVSLLGHQQFQSSQVNNAPTILIGMHSSGSWANNFKMLKDPDLSSFAKLKSQIVEFLNLTVKHKIVLLLSNLFNQAENIIIDTEDDFRLLKQHSYIYGESINLQALIYESSTEIEDGCCLFELRPSSGDSMGSIQKSEAPYLKDFTLMPSVMLINYSKFIQILTIKDDNLTLDMNVFENFDCKVKKLVQSTGQGKQFMTRSQLSKYQLYWSNTSIFGKSQVEENKNSALQNSSVGSKSVTESKPQDSNLKNDREDIQIKAINEELRSDSNFQEHKEKKVDDGTIAQEMTQRHHLNVEDNNDDENMSEDESEEVNDDSRRYDSDQENEESYEMVDCYFKNQDQRVNELVEPSLTAYIQNELLIQEKLDQQPKESKLKCEKCTILLKSERDIYYSCQQCQSLFLCEQCEDIYTHTHPFQKLRPDPTLLNLDKLQMKYKQVEALELSLSESVYDCNQIIKRIFILKNSGEFEWPEDTKLFLIDNPFGVVTNTPIKMGGATLASQSRKVTIKLKTPQDMGKYRLLFRLGIHGKFNHSQNYHDKKNNIHYFGKPMCLEFEVLEPQSHIELHSQDLLMSQEGILMKSQILNEDYLKLELQKQDYKDQLRNLASSQIISQQPLSRERKRAHKFLMKLGFYDFQRNEQLLKNCKDNLQVVSQILIQEQMKALKI